MASSGGMEVGQLIVLLEQTWDARCGLGTVDELRAVETLGQAGRRVEKLALPRLIDVHPLVEIARAMLALVREHAEALEVLPATKASLVHARQVEEIATTVAYLVRQRDRYNEFGWRWKNYPLIHTIRNRLFNLKLELGADVERWIRSNIDYFRMVNPKFTGDIDKDRKLWERFQNWLSPITLKQVFEGVGKTEQYRFTTYDWESHFVHFSPLADPLFDLDGSQGPFRDLMLEFVEYQIHSMLRTLSPLSTAPEEFRRESMRLAFRSFYHLARKQPDRFAALAEKSQRLRRFAREVVRDDFNRARFESSVLGAPPDDPLVIKI